MATNDQLIEQIDALLVMNKTGQVSHRIPGLAVELLTRAREALTTQPAAPQEAEAARIGDAVLDWMVKYDLLDGGNEYSAADVIAVLNDLTPSDSPAAQAVTEAQIEQRAHEIAVRVATSGKTGRIHQMAYDAAKEGARAALTAAQEAGR